MKWQYLPSFVHYTFYFKHTHEVHSYIFSIFIFATSYMIIAFWNVSIQFVFKFYQNQICCYICYASKKGLIIFQSYKSHGI